MEPNLDVDPSLAQGLQELAAIAEEELQCKDILLCTLLKTDA